MFDSPIFSLANKVDMIVLNLALNLKIFRHFCIFINLATPKPQNPKTPLIEKKVKKHQSRLRFLRSQLKSIFEKPLF